MMFKQGLSLASRSDNVESKPPECQSSRPFLRLAPYEASYPSHKCRYDASVSISQAE